MNPIVEAIEAMPAAQREGALLVLDMLTRPLTAREIEAAMLGRGVSRSQRRIVTGAIKHLNVIAVVGGEHG